MDWLTGQNWITFQCNVVKGIEIRINIYLSVHIILLAGDYGSLDVPDYTLHLFSLSFLSSKIVPLPLLYCTEYRRMWGNRRGKMSRRKYKREDENLGFTQGWNPIFAAAAVVVLLNVCWEIDYFSSTLWKGCYPDIMCMVHLITFVHHEMVCKKRKGKFVEKCLHRRKENEANAESIRCNAYILILIHLL